MEAQKQQATKKEVATKVNNSSLALPEELKGSWGAEEAGSEDIIIPKLLLMHGQSTKVLEGEKSQGDLVRSTDWETLAKKGSTIKVIPFKIFKSWRISEKVGDKFEYRKNEPYKMGERENLVWEFEQEGKLMRRDFCYNFYCMLSGNTAGFPMVLQFTRTSSKAGKVLADHFAKCKMMQVPPASQSFEIGSEFVNGEKNKYFIFTAKASAGTTREELTACKQWFDLINLNPAQVKEHDVEEVVQAEATNKVEEF